MPLITLDNAHLAYGHVALLDRVQLVIESGERIGLIGRNGGGKSSLLRIIAGERALDDGTLWRLPGLIIGYVPQEPEFALEDSVFDAVAAGLGGFTALITEYHRVSAALAGDHSLTTRLAELQHELEVTDGWRAANRIETVIAQLGLAADSRVETLSGGQRKRVALARALVAEPQLLILDEPTNHLDIDSIAWLEGLLRNFPGSVLFVTHDRRFLDATATRILELDRGRLVSFPGSFTEYQRRKQDMLAVEAVEQYKFDKLLAQEEAWIRKGIEARRTRNEGRVRQLERLRLERQRRRERIGQVNFTMDSGERSGKLVAELVKVSKSFADKVIVRDFSCRIQRGDRVGLIGPNGAGKTTLLKLILGELAPDGGSVRLGTKLGVAYFDQLRERLDEEATLLDVISQGSEFLDIGGEKKHVMTYLSDFLFPPERARAKVSSLSGGERNRLLLARLFTRPANVLVLDEPTNDLDIETLELLEALLQDYDGTIFLVSHDRAFLDNVVTSTLVMEGDGRVGEYVGGYADWLRQRPVPSRASAAPVRRSAPTPAAPRQADRKRRLSFKETQELAALPERIEALERERVQLYASLADPALLRVGGAAEVSARLRVLEVELAAHMARWEALELIVAGD
jgi:ATP-binding cassette subfamily F protein uup